MARLTEEKILEIQRLYKEIGIYSQVAKQVGCSPSTVKKYCTAAEPINKSKVIRKFEGQIPEISDLDLTFFLEKSIYLTTLTLQEKENMKELWEEL